MSRDKGGGAMGCSVLLHLTSLEVCERRATMKNSRERNKLFASASWEMEKGNLPRPPGKILAR
eukprot:7229956-Prymnesium_polylepis.1